MRALTVVGCAIVILTGCSSGSGRIGVRDSGGGSSDGAATSTLADASGDLTGVQPGAPDADASALPSDAASTVDGAGLPDTASADGPGKDGAVSTSDRAITDGPGAGGADGSPDAPTSDVAGKNDGVAGPSDSPRDRGLDAASSDGPPVLALGFRYVAAGVSFTCALGTDDSLWCWGDLASTVATRLDATRAWQSVDLGVDSACAIAKDGTLWCWGTNLNKELGLSNVGSTGVTVPTQVGAESDWQQVSMGVTVTCGVRGAGDLWCWGTSGGGGGEVGDGTSGSHASPIAISQTSDWTAVSAGDTHTCGIRAPGSLWCWGQSSWGQLGLGAGQPPLSQPIASKVPARVGSEENWVAVSAGGSHTCGIRSDGTLWCWGSNTAGQLGVTTAPLTYAASPAQVGADSDWLSVSAGSQHTCARRADKTVWCWGSSTYGQVGNGGQANVLAPTQVGSESNWSQVQSGGMHTCGVKDDKSLWCWGRNHSGQLGIGSMPIHKTMTQVGQDSDWQRVTTQGLHTCGLRAGALWCWGQNTYGNLGDGTTENRQVPTRVGNAADWTTVVVGQWTTCGLRADHSLWCWGANGNGQLGVGTAQTAPSGIATTPQQVGADKTWLAVDAALHTCALASDGALWCWGPNSYGEASPSGSGFDVPTRFGTDNDWAAISLDAGRTCGIRTDNSLWCWGYQLASQPAQIGTTLDWRTASARYQYFCGIKTDGSLWCGDLKSTLVQRGTAVDWIEATPACGVRATGALYCQLASGLGASFDSATDWMTAGAADQFLCGVKRNGTLWCSGVGQTGEMGHGDAWRTAPVQALMTP